jgi:hypothetical protein
MSNPEVRGRSLSYHYPNSTAINVLHESPPTLPEKQKGYSYISVEKAFCLIFCLHVHLCIQNENVKLNCATQNAC